MHIVIVGGWTDFPHGGASASRIFFLSKGLVHSNNEVKILFQGRVSENSKIEGTVDTIEYSYCTKFIPRKKSIMTHIRFALRFERIKTIFKLIQIHKKNKLDAVLLYSRDFGMVWPLAIMGKIIKCPIILELCEWPLSQVEHLLFQKINAFLFCTFAFYMVNGILPISTALRKKVDGKNKKSLQVPILIDSVEFQCGVSDKEIERYFVLGGSAGYWDILKVVICSFNEFKSKVFNKYRIIITGVQKDVAEKKLELSQDYFSDVEFPGYLKRSKFVDLLIKSTAVMIPLPDNDRSVNRFPTKLGEYLASGRPVITTNVGEIGVYLKHRINAFIAADFNPLEIADIMKYVVDNPVEATMVGADGRKLAESEFDYRIQGSKLSNFINELKIENMFL